MDADQTPRKESASCPMDFILRMLMGPWTTYILYNLRTHGPQRFGELKRRVNGISAKMLTERSGRVTFDDVAGMRDAVEARVSASWCSFKRCSR